MIRHTASGLVVAEDAADERAIQAALQDHDRDLRLSRESHPAGGIEYVVVFTRGDQAAIVVCRWRDEVTGQALPLSHGLVAKVKTLDLNSRAVRLDAFAHNDALIEQVEREMSEAAEDIARDIERRHGRLPVFHPSRALQLSRSRARRVKEIR